MKFLIFIFCAILGLSVSVPIENASTENEKFVQFNRIVSKPLPQANARTHRNPTNRAVEHHEMKFIAADTKDYIFLSDWLGKVIIIGIDPYEEIISYSLPEISKTISAIVKDTFYYIDTPNGTIHSTNVGNLLQGPDNIIWAHVGNFPKDTHFLRCGSAVDGSIIYFVTYSGNLYSYNTALSTTYKVGEIEVGDFYASLAVVENVLYIHKFNHFYSYNGTSVKTVATPESRRYAGLFQQGNDVCLVGGNLTDVYPDPVYCYNPSNERWSTPSHINDARWYPGVATIGLRTFIFGGYASIGDSSFLRDSVEVLDHETNVWGFYPTPLSENQQYIQPLAFKF